MKTKYDTYNRWASFFIVTCETLITGGLFYALFLATESTPWYKILKAVRTYEQRTTIRYQVSEISAFYPDCW